MIGKTVGHYQIVDKLGEGGMGEVWLAEDTRLQRKVAIKFLPHYANADESEKARFIQEARAAAQISHPNIAQVYEIDEEEGLLFIVMEYVEGGSLKERLERAADRALPLDSVVDWAIEAAEGLAEAHSRGIIHRDIKPDNLVLDTKERLKITDFGLARLETSTRLTASGVMLGTVGYVSPEQIKGHHLDPRSDLFSLGATFYELLTGVQPFHGPDAHSIYYAVLSSEPEPPSSLRPEIPKKLDQIITRLLRKDPEERYQSADEIITDLKGLRRTMEYPFPETAETIRRWTWRKAPPATRALMVAAAVVVVVVAVLMILPRSKRVEAVGLWVSRDEWPVQLNVISPEVVSLDSTSAYIARALSDRFVDVLNAYWPISARKIDSGAGTDGIELRAQLHPQGTDYRLDVSITDIESDELLFQSTYEKTRGATLASTVDALAIDVIAEVMQGLGLHLPEDWRPNLGVFQAHSDRVAGVVDRSRRYLEEGLPDLAAREIQKALDEGNQEPILRYYLGQCLAAEEKWTDSAEAYGMALPATSRSEVIAWSNHISLDMPCRTSYVYLRVSTPDIYVLEWDSFGLSGGYSPRLVGVSSVNGEVLWNRLVSYSPYPVIQFGTTAIFERSTPAGRSLFALNIRTGEDLWSTSLTDIDPNFYPRFVSDENRFYEIGDDRIYAYDKSTGSKLWGPVDNVFYTNFGMFLSSNDVTKAIVLDAPGAPDSIAVLEPETGKVDIFALPLPEAGWRFLLGGILIQANPTEGELTGHDPTTHRQLWRLRDSRLESMQWAVDNRNWLHPNEISSYPDNGSPLSLYIPRQDHAIVVVQLQEDLASTPRILWELKLEQFELKGEDLWRLPSYQVGNHIYLKTSDDWVAVIDATEGVVLARINLQTADQWQIVEGSQETAILVGINRLMLVDGPDVIWQRPIPGLERAYLFGGLVYADLANNTAQVLDVVDGASLTTIGPLSDRLLPTGEGLGWITLGGVPLLGQYVYTDLDTTRAIEGIRLLSLQRALQRGGISRAEILSRRAEALWRAGETEQLQRTLLLASSSPGVEPWKIPLLQMRIHAAENDTAGVLAAAAHVYELTTERESTRASAFGRLRELTGITWVKEGYPNSELHTVGGSEDVVIAYPLSGSNRLLAALDIATGDQTWSKALTLNDAVFLGPKTPSTLFVRRQNQRPKWSDTAVEAVDIRSGNVLWSKTVGSRPDTLLYNAQTSIPLSKELVAMVFDDARNVSREGIPDGVLPQLVGATLNRVDPATQEVTWSRRIQVDFSNMGPPGSPTPSLFVSPDYILVESPIRALGVVRTGYVEQDRKIQRYDTILEVGGEPVWDSIHIIDLISEANGDSTHTKVRRVSGEIEELYIHPSTEFTEYELDPLYPAFTRNQEYIVLRTATGDSVTRLPLGKVVDNLAFIDGAGLIVSDNNEDNFVCYDLETGAERWRIYPVKENAIGGSYRPESRIHSGELLIDWGYAPVGAEHDAVFALSIGGSDAGTLRWKRIMTSMRQLVTANADSTHVAVMGWSAEETDTMLLEILDSRNGTTLYRCRVPWIPVAEPWAIMFVDYGLIVSTDEGYIYRINIPGL